MTRISMNRRQMLAGLTSTGTLSAWAMPVSARLRARIVVVGGGFGGSTAARFAKQFLPQADVTLIEPNATYTACPFSNLVIGGTRNISTQIFGYDGLRARGVTVTHDRAISIDPSRRSVTGEDGSTWGYDKLILAPGIDFRWDAIEGYDAEATALMPHAWKGGAQTLLLRKQLEAMPDGGVAVMSIPPAPFRCPPGPYERASLIAEYFKRQKPKSKLLILDAQDTFSKQPLFEEAWTSMYPGIIERRGAMEPGRVVSLDAQAGTLSTEFETFKADVANVVPPQMAATIAATAGVADATGWCPVDPVSFASTLQPDIHVIGDAIIAAPMPKSAFAANLQAKLCALQVSRALAGLAPQSSKLTNTCYSFTSSDMAVSITGVYSTSGGAFQTVEGSGGISPPGADNAQRNAEAAQARSWFETITQQAFG